MRVALASVVFAAACVSTPDPVYLSGFSSRFAGGGSGSGGAVGGGGGPDGKATLGDPATATATLVVRVGQPFTTVAIQPAQEVNVPAQGLVFTGADGTVTVKLAPGAYYVASGLEAGQACNFTVATASAAAPAAVSLTIDGVDGATVEASSASGATVALERRQQDGTVVALSDAAPQFGAIVVSGDYRFTATDGAQSEWTHVDAGGQLSVTLTR